MPARRDPPANSWNRAVRTWLRSGNRTIPKRGTQAHRRLSNLHARIKSGGK